MLNACTTFLEYILEVNNGVEYIADISGVMQKFDERILNKKCRSKVVGSCWFSITNYSEATHSRKKRKNLFQTEIEREFI